MSKRRVRPGSRGDSAEQSRNLFVQFYIANGGNATQAAIAAGYAEKSAGSKGAQLLKEVKVAEAIDLKRAEILVRLQESTEVTVERTLMEVGRLAFADVGSFFDEAGQLRPLHTLPAGVRAAIASFEFEAITAGKGDEAIVVGNVRKVKLNDKNSALDKAMKYLGLFKKDNEQQPAAALPAPILEMHFHQAPKRRD